MSGTRKEPVELAPRIWTWSPASVFEEMDRLLNEMRSGFVLPVHDILHKEGTRMPSVDLREEEDRFLIQADMPGMSRDNVSIEMDGDVLKITASKEHELEEKDKGYIRRERGSMRFFRQVRLPENVDEDNIKAKMENGVLEVSLPKKPVTEEKKSKIEVE